MINLSIIGNIGKDAEIVTIKERKFCKFNVATKFNETVTQWISCLKEDKDEKLKPYLLKGTQVFCSGKPKFNAYKDKEGNTHADTSLFVTEFEFVGKKESKEDKPDDLPF